MVEIKIVRTGGGEGANDTMSLLCIAIDSADEKLWSGDNRPAIKTSFVAIVVPSHLHIPHLASKLTALSTDQD